MELAAFLALLLNGLSSTAAWYLIDHVKMLMALEPDTKRYVAYAISAVIAILAYLGLIVIGEKPAPVGGVVSWVEQFFYVGTAAFGLATILNGPKLAKYRSDAKT